MDYEMSVISQHSDGLYIWTLQLFKALRLLFYFIAQIILYAFVFCIFIYGYPLHWKVKKDCLKHHNLIY